MIAAFIFARGGSKGVPGKNIKLLHGKPLITHAIECAASTKHVNKVIVSTDSFDIASIAYTEGADVLFRPDELCTDESPEWLSWQHAMREVGCDMFVSVPTTCPMRKPEDIDACIEYLGQHGWKANQPGAVVTVTKPRDNPYYVATVRQESGRILPAFGAKHPVRRQLAPEIFNIVGVAYAAWPLYIKNYHYLLEGMVGSVEVPQERALDIDTPHDFEIAEALMAGPYPPLMRVYGEKISAG